MDFEPEYKVFQTDPLGFVDSPTIITTLYKEQSGNPRGEWFLIVPDLTKTQLVSRQVTLTAPFPKGPVAFTPSEFLDELLRQANNALRRHIQETRNQNDASWILARRIAELPSNRNLFISLWMNGGCEEILTNIANTTLCAPLKEFLDWVVTELPKFTIKPA